MMERFSLLRDGEASLAFSGFRIATVTSSNRGKKAWTELSLFQTETGRFVVQTVARVAPGAKFNGVDGRDWYSARDFDTAAEVIAGLRDRKTRSLSRLAIELLEDAAEESDSICEALDALETTEEVVR